MPCYPPESDLTGLQRRSTFLEPRRMGGTLVLSCTRNREIFRLLIPSVWVLLRIEIMKSVAWAQGQPQKFNCSSALVKD